MSPDGSRSPKPPGGPGRPAAGPSSRGRLLFALGAVVIAALGIRWIVAEGDGGEGPRFRTAAADTREVVQTVEATGRLRPRDAMLVLAPVGGRLAEVSVRTRQVVTKGDLLARLDARSLGFEVRRAEAGVAAAQGAVAEAKAAAVEAAQQRRRASKLAGRGQLSQADLQAAVSASQRAKAAVQVATARLNEAQASLRAATFAAEQTDVVSPRDGVVLTVPNELGLAVSPAGPVLFTISAPLDVLRLEAAVGEADIGQLAVGQPAEFEVQAYPRRKFTAKVEAIGVVANGERGVATYSVQLSAPNDDGRLLPGMSAAVRFEVARAENVLAVRDSALRFTPAGAPDASPRSRVFKVYDDGSVEPIAVKVGISDGVWVQVESSEGDALKAGDPLAEGYLSGGAGGEPRLRIGGK